ncbi:MAG: hypothetical protein AAGA28_06345 [Pseudomonadota bacterium]
MPHTGADLIQRNLSTNTDWLTEHGIGYGDVMAQGASHDTLWVACAKAVPLIAEKYGVTTAQDQEELRQYIGQALTWERAQLPAHVDRMVLSCSGLYGFMRHPDAVQELKSLLEPHFDAVDLILYVRRQDDVILADYANAVRLGSTNDTLAEYASACLRPDISRTPYLFYKHEVSKWLDVWGDTALTLRRYSSTDFIDGDLVTDMLGVLLGTWDPDLTGFSRAPEMNGSLSAPGVAFFRELNRALDADRAGDMPAVQVHKLFHRLSEISLPASPRPIMPADLSHKIMTHFAGANMWLQERFAPDLDGPFFPERPDHPEFGNTDRMSTDDAISLSGRLLASLMQEGP